MLNGTLPGELTQLTKLTFLAVGGNAISGSIPAGIGSMTNLALLAFDENPIKGTTPTEIGLLKSLREYECCRSIWVLIT
jgi:Leucine-rich repeat (LRR) protein